MSETIKLLTGCGDINRLTVSKGQIKVISKWNLIGRIIHWLHKDQECVAVINKIREILINDGIQTIRGREGAYQGQEFSVQLLTQEQVEALLNNKVLPVFPRIPPLPIAQEEKVVDLKKPVESQKKKMKLWSSNMATSPLISIKK